jgi:hypothetical protein
VDIDKINQLYYQHLQTLNDGATAPNPASYGRVIPGSEMGTENEEDAENYVPGMTFSQFLEKLIAVLGGKGDLQGKLRAVASMAFQAKRHMENNEDGEEGTDDSEEGELMTHMKQKGLIPQSATTATTFSRTREKR